MERQGSPLSVYICILFFEPVLKFIMMKQTIRGVHLLGCREEDITYVSYADDVTQVLLNLYSVNQTVDVFNNFFLASGLKLNFPSQRV